MPASGASLSVAMIAILSRAWPAPKLPRSVGAIPCGCPTNPALLNNLAAGHFLFAFKTNREFS